MPCGRDKRDVGIFRLGFGFFLWQHSPTSRGDRPVWELAGGLLAQLVGWGEAPWSRACLGRTPKEKLASAQGSEQQRGLQVEGTQKKIGWERPLVGGQLSLCPRAGEQAGSGGTGSSLRGPLQPCSAPVAALVWVRGGEGGGVCSQSRSRGH